MFKRKPKSDVDMYVSADDNVRKYMKKYKDTGKDKFKDKARHYKATKKALEIKMSNTGTNVNETNVTVSESFNKEKTTNVDVTTNIDVNQQKKNSKKK